MSLDNTPNSEKKSREKIPSWILFPLGRNQRFGVLDVFHEESTQMSDSNEMWYGYLEAGEKSSPVLIDPGLETGNSKTVYMYNLHSQRIIEYKRDIAEPKLRQLSQQETSWVKELTKGYSTARKEFKPRANGVATIPSGDKTTAINPPSKSQKADQLGNFDESMDEFDIGDDEDLDISDDLEEEETEEGED